MEGLWKLGRPVWGVRTLTQQGGIGTELGGGGGVCESNNLAPPVLLPWCYQRFNFSILKMKENYLNGDLYILCKKESEAEGQL